MGVLDEAIREHLELKRRHGADPSEVAQLERRALGPVHEPHRIAVHEHHETIGEDPQHNGSCSQPQGDASGPYAAYRQDAPQRRLQGRSARSEQGPEETIEIEISELFGSPQDDRGGEEEPTPDPVPDRAPLVAAAPQEDALGIEESAPDRRERRSPLDRARRSVGRFPSHR
ncbi:MAG: hypothetical protein ACYCU0_11545 [Solirubrobacteraceae bacterium]